ncbi:hypothetical protein MIMGU_mgv1a0248832mg, partial [Erythranthe guttata]
MDERVRCSAPCIRDRPFICHIIFT